MSIFFIIIAIVQGFAAVGLLALLEAIINHFSPGFSLPFSYWWGMIVALPTFGMGLFFSGFDR